MCMTCIGVRSRECYTPFRAACSHAGVGSIVLGLRSRSRVLPPSACFVVKATKVPLLTCLGGVGCRLSPVFTGLYTVNTV